MDLVEPKENAKFVSFQCTDGYAAFLSLDELLEEDALLAYELNGKCVGEGVGVS